MFLRKKNIKIWSEVFQIFKRNSNIIGVNSEVSSAFWNTNNQNSTCDLFNKALVQHHLIGRVAYFKTWHLNVTSVQTNRHKLVYFLMWTGLSLNVDTNLWCWVKVEDLTAVETLWWIIDLIRFNPVILGFGGWQLFSVFLSYSRHVLAQTAPHDWSFCIHLQDVYAAIYKQTDRQHIQSEPAGPWFVGEKPELPEKTKLMWSWHRDELTALTKWGARRWWWWWWRRRAAGGEDV